MKAGFYQLPLEEQEQLLASFTKSVADTIYETLLARDHLDNTIVAKKFTQFLKQKITRQRLLQPFECFYYNKNKAF